MDVRFFTRLRDFDVYPKTLQDFQVKTLAGTTMSIIGIVVIVTLPFEAVPMWQR